MKDNWGLLPEITLNVTFSKKKGYNRRNIGALSSLKLQQIKLWIHTTDFSLDFSKLHSTLSNVVSSTCKGNIWENIIVSGSE